MVDKIYFGIREVLQLEALGKLFHFFLPCVLIHYQGLFPKDLLREAALY